MGECLGEVTEEIAGLGVDHLGKEAKMIGVAEESFKKAAGFVRLAHPSQHSHQPETAKDERAFTAGDAIIFGCRLGAEDADPGIPILVKRKGAPTAYGSMDY